MKALLVAGLISAGAVLSSQAQTVYSINAVGFVNVNVPTGFSIIANPLVSSDNTIGHIIPAPPQGTRIYKYNGAGFDLAIYDLDDNNNLNWDNPSISLVPGEAAFIKNTSGSAFTLTFVGEVAQSSQSNISIPAGFSMRSSTVPQSGQLDTVLGFPVAQNDRVYRFLNGNYTVSIYSPDDNNVLNWDTAPVPSVGEGFWVYTSGAKTWTRNFSIAN